MKSSIRNCHTKTLDIDVISNLLNYELRTNKIIRPITENIYFKILIPCIAAGAIIGKGGEAIAVIQKETGAKVKISKSYDFYPGTTERICLIMGNVDAVTQVHSYIIDKIQEKPDILARQVIDGKGAVERHKQVKILVPNSTAGMIIGKSGCYIKEIKEKSGSFVQISQKSKEINLSERCVIVAGEKDQNRIATDMIIGKISEDPHSNSCPTISYVDIVGPVASAYPTGSPYAMISHHMSVSMTCVNESCIGISGSNENVSGNSSSSCHSGSSSSSSSSSNCGAISLGGNGHYYHNHNHRHHQQQQQQQQQQQHLQQQQQQQQQQQHQNHYQQQSLSQHQHKYQLQPQLQQKQQQSQKPHNNPSHSLIYSSSTSTNFTQYSSESASPNASAVSITGDVIDAVADRAVINPVTFIVNSDSPQPPNIIQNSNQDSSTSLTGIVPQSDIDRSFFEEISTQYSNEPHYSAVEIIKNILRLSGFSVKASHAISKAIETLYQYGFINTNYSFKSRNISPSRSGKQLNITLYDSFPLYAMPNSDEAQTNTPLEFLVNSYINHINQKTDDIVNDNSVDNNNVVRNVEISAEKMAYFGSVDSPIMMDIKSKTSVDIKVDREKSRPSDGIYSLQVSGSNLDNILEAIGMIIYSSADSKVPVNFQCAY